VPRGTVLALHRFPVKSMGGERLDALHLDEHGAEGDRRYALWQKGDRRLTARVAPRMLAWRASADGALTVTAPDGRAFAWGKELQQAVSEDLGREVDLVRDPRGMPDAAAVHVTVEASRRALEQELGAPLDIRRFRPNVHLDLDAAPFAEERGEGRTLRIGDAELKVVGPTDRCAITIRDPETIEASPDVLRVVNEEHASLFGVWADVRAAGRIAVGDPVTVA
jgi:uncharacterized protein